MKHTTNIHPPWVQSGVISPWPAWFSFEATIHGENQPNLAYELIQRFSHPAEAYVQSPTANPKPSKKTAELQDTFSETVTE